MSGMTFLMILGLSASLVDVVDANAFLKANAASHEERISEEDVQTSLLAEVEGTFGWALVSEPGFLKFQIFRFSILAIFFGEHIFENYVGEISRNK